MKHGIITFALLALFLFTNKVTGQTLNDVVTAYNAAVTRTDTVGKIKALDDCILLCTKVGAPADSIKTNAGKVLANTYYQKASLPYKNQKFAESALAFEDVIKFSKQYKDTVVLGRAQKYLSVSYNELGNDAKEQKKYAEAIKYYEKVLALNPQHIRAMFNTASAYSKLNNKAKFEEFLTKTLDLAKTTNDTKTEADANKTAKSFYVASFSNLSKQGKANEAVASLKTAMVYSPDDKDLYYYIGQAYNTQKKYDLALENLNKGLELETGKPEDKAKYYYELGQAYKGKADNVKACSAFQNAMFGKFAQFAKDERTKLKCK